MSNWRAVRLPYRPFVAVIASLLLIVISLPACAPQGPTAEEQAAQAEEQAQADREAIDSMRDEFVAAFNAGDLDAVMGFYTENVVVLSPDGPPAEGQEAARAALEEVYAQGTPNLALTSHEIEIHGDVAFDRGAYELMLVPAVPEGSEAVEQPAPVTETGDWVTVLKRTEDGSWKVHWDIWNVDRAVMAEPEAAQ